MLHFNHKSKTCHSLMKQNMTRSPPPPPLPPPVCLPADPWFWMLCFSDMRWLRNQVVAPLTEELVFRACMLPMLVPCAGPSTAIFTCPLFFGVGEFCLLFPPPNVRRDWSMLLMFMLVTVLTDLYLWSCSSVTVILSNPCCSSESLGVFFQTPI